MGTFAFHHGNAQVPGLRWARALNGTASGTAYPESIATDGQRNVYTVGSFRNTIDANPGAGFFPLTSAGNDDIFVSKLDANGSFVWAVRIGSTGQDIAYAVTVDNTGLVYVTGSYTATVDFDPTPGTFNLTGGGAFAFRLNSNGTLSWAGRIGSGNGKAIAIDLVNTLVIAGDFTGSSDFDPGPGTTTLTSAGSSDIFVSKFLLDGTLVWANRMGGAAADNADGVDTDASNNIYTTGAFTGTADFNPGGAVNNLVSAGSIDAYVSKLDASGGYVWAVRVGAAGAERANAITVDGSGDVLATGNFSGTVDFDPGGTVFNMTSAGSSDIFVLKVTSNGTFVWGRNMGGPSSDVPSGIAADATGGVYTTGYFNGTADFDPGAAVFNLTSGTGNQESFISKLTSAGNFAWAFRTESVAGGETEGVDVAIDLAGDILIAGWFEFTVDFDPGPCNYNLLSNGDDIYIMKLSPASLGCIPPTITSFSPASGPVGTTVIIDGVQFSPTPSNNVVYFGATRAMVTAATSTSLTVTVPVGATYEPISVTVGGLTGWSTSAFNITFPGGGQINTCAFSPSVQFGLSNFGHGLASGDIDGDGKADIIEANAGGVVQVFRNIATTGSITAASFAAAVDLPIGTSPYHSILADIDGDGKLDIVATAQSSNRLAIYRNNSSPGSISAASFDTRLDLSTGVNPMTVAARDLDGDGKVDIVVMDNSGIRVWQNIGSPGSITAATFAAPFVIATPSAGVTIADIDVDGKPDLIAGNIIGTQVGVSRNISTPGSLSTASFQTAVNFTVGPWTDWIEVADVDNDNRPDIVATSWPAPGSFSILQNTSTPGTINASSFASQVLFSSPSVSEARGVVVTDLDGDGLPDVAVASQTSSQVYVYKNIGPAGTISTGSFATRVGFPAGGNIRGVIADDFDGDNRPELAVSNWGGPALSVLHNQTAMPTIAGISPSSAIMGAQVVINGNNFSTTPSENIVTFNGTTATVVSSTATSITVIVPNNATTGTVTVNLYCNSATSGTFTILPFTPPCGNVLLNGGVDRISFSDQPSLEPAAVTVEAWVKVNAFTSTKSGGNTTAQFILFKRNQLVNFSEGYDLVMDESSKQFMGVVSSGAGGGGSQRIISTSPNFVNLSQWYHLALTADNTSVSFYVNGQLIGTLATGFALNYGPEGLSIGNTSPLNAWQGAFNGNVDEVRIWNSVRSQSQIQSTMTGTLTGGETGLIAYYNMETIGQGAGITVANSATATGAVNNGVSVGSATTPVFSGVCSCIPTTERNALIALYNSTGGASWTNNNNWLSADETTWNGVVSTGCHITELNLQFNNLVGTIPPEIGDLTELTTLRLSSNQLSGTLPDEITNLVNLEYLFINSNSIGGTLPATIGNMTSLKSIDTQLNAFSGPIPASLANCTALASIQLEGNQHTGNIPSFLGDLTNLFSINLGFNQFDGVIPPELGNLGNLSFLSLAENDLFGEIPPELGDLDQLGILDLSRNQISGSIPSELGNCTNLGSLQLWDNQLSGGIPQEIDNLANLSELNLSQNFLGGNIPGWTAIPSLYYLNLSQNFLEGDLPSSLGNHLAIEEMYLNNNFLIGDIPQEVADLPALRILDVSSNQFDQLRGFASPTMTDLHVSNNHFDFGDLELNIAVPNYSYDPQALLPPGGHITFTPGGTLSIPFATPGSVNSYQWFKGTTGITGATFPTLTRPGMTAADAGYYTVQVTSTLVTGIILTSRSYVVTSDPCSPGGPNGDNDPAFVPDIGGSDQGALGVELQSDGKIIVLGYGNTHLSSNVDGVFRLNPNGTFDNTFTVYGQGYGILVQPDDKILVNNGSNFVRLNSDGTEDNTFNSNVPSFYNANISAIALQPDGKILLSVSEDSSPYVIYRLNSDGTNDASFSGPTGLDVNVIRVQPDGKILLGGSFPNGMMRLTSTGAFDTAFNENGVDGVVFDFAVQPDGKIIAVGGFFYFNGEETRNIVRMDAAGNIDPMFVSMGITDLTELNSVIYRVLLQPDGDIILAGSFHEVSGTARPDIVRLGPDGSIRCTFDSQAGTDGTIYDAALQPNGHILITGYFQDYNAVPNSGFNRVLNGQALDNSIKFNGTNQELESGTWFNHQNFTVSMWVKPGSTQTAYANIIDNNHTGARSWVFQQLNTTLNRYDFRTAQVDLAADVWQHITLTSNSGTFSIYLNGCLVSTATAPLINYDGTQFLRLGRWGGGGRYWNGEMDEVRLYDRVLSDAEIAAAVYTAIPPTTPNLLAYYKLDESSGPTAFDATPNNRDGTLLNGPTFQPTGVPTAPILPTIGSYSPSNGPVGTAVTITGTNFGTDPAYLSVTFAGIPASFTLNSPTSITAYVPPGFSSGKIRVTSLCNFVESLTDFTATPSPDNSIKFNGVDQETQLGTWFNYQNFTVSFWLKPGGTQRDWAVIIDNNHTGSRSWVFQQDFNNVNRYDFRTAEVTLTAGQWQHVTLTANSGVYSVYLNGCLVSTVTGTLINYDGTQTLKLGDWSVGVVDPWPNRSWNGEMDEVKFYDRVLTDAEILSDVFAEISPTTPNLLAYYKMNEAGGPQHYDATAAAHNGTAINGPTFQLAGRPAIALPTITSFTPSSGVAGTFVTITGTNFTSPYFSTTVQFNGVNAAIIDLQSASIQVSVPAGTSTGPIQVSVGCNVATSSTNFSFCSPPAPPGPVPASRCGSGTVVLGATGSVNGNYRWYMTSSGGLPIAGEVNSTYTTPILTSTTTFYASIIVGTCESATRTAVTATINTLPVPPTTTGATSCVAAAMTLSATGGVNGQYRWYTVPTGGTAIAGEVNDTYTTPVVTTTTTYHVAINDGTCESLRTPVSATIDVVAKPSITVSNCTATGATLTGPAGFTTYTWSTGATTPSIAVTAAGSYTLVVTNASGCTSPTSDPSIFTAAFCNQPPVLQPTTVTTTIEGTVTIDLTALATDLDNNVDLTTLQVIQQPVSGAVASITPAHELVVDYTDIPFVGTDELTIRVCDMAGACGQEIVTIEVNGDIKVYNALSPNGDGKNDTFIIQYIEALPETQKNKVTIFNRWGAVVFEATDYNNSSTVFKGLSNNGDELPSGTYFYTIEFSSGAEKRNGFISLRR